MLLTEKIENLLNPIASDYDMYIVQIYYGAKTLQILVEKTDGSAPTIKGCEELSRAFAATLDVEDVISERYFLEVGSAGMDRPLTKLSDFEKFMGREVKLELKMPRNTEDERKRFKGKIEKIEGSKISLFTHLDDEDKTIEFEYDNVLKAKLLVSEDLIKEILKNNKKEQKEQKERKDK